MLGISFFALSLSLPLQPIHPSDFSGRSPMASSTLVLEAIKAEIGKNSFAHMYIEAISNLIWAFIVHPGFEPSSRKIGEIFISPFQKRAKLLSQRKNWDEECCIAGCYRPCTSNSGALWFCDNHQLFLEAHEARHGHSQIGRLVGLMLVEDATGYDHISAAAPSIFGMFVEFNVILNYLKHTQKPYFLCCEPRQVYGPNSNMSAFVMNFLVQEHVMIDISIRKLIGEYIRDVPLSRISELTLTEWSSTPVIVNTRSHLTGCVCKGNFQDGWYIVSSRVVNGFDDTQWRQCECKGVNYKW